MVSRVSVIIPVYNGENYLNLAIDSVLSQSYPYLELIVVDDGSTDQTHSIIESYGSKVRGISKENGGVASALNKGIENANGNYISWLSHDDLYLPNKLELQMEFLYRNPNSKACYTDYYDIDENGEITQSVICPWYPRQIALQKMFSFAYINGSTMLIEKSCFDQVGLFTQQYRYVQDTEMWLRILARFEIGRVPEKLVKYRKHPGQGSKNNAIRFETKKMYKNIFLSMGIKTLLPQLALTSDEPKTIASSYEWFGDCMTRQYLFKFAQEQYKESVSLWPSWRNMARYKFAFGMWVLILPQIIMSLFSKTKFLINPVRN